MKKQYYSEDELVEKVQYGEMDMVGYVTHHSEEWDEEYDEFCRERQLDPDDEKSADAFLGYKDDLLTKAHEGGEI